MSQLQLHETSKIQPFRLVISEKDAKPIWEVLGESIMRETFSKLNVNADGELDFGNYTDTLILSGNHVIVVEGQKIDLPDWPVHTTFYPITGGIAFMVGEDAQALTLPGDAPNRQEFLDRLQIRNQMAGFRLPTVLKKFIAELARPGVLSVKSDILPPVLCFTADNINRAAVTAFSRIAQWQTGEKYFRGFEQEFKSLKITVSLPNGDQAASLWEFLQRGGAAMVKAHYALWARYYEQVSDGLKVQQDVLVNVNDFCRDLGYAKAVNGGYKVETKRRAMQLLEALTTTEMAATYQVPGTKKGHVKMRRLKGTIWRRGLEAEERDTYEDLFGQVRAGDPSGWIPEGFSFSPGAWYADEEWRRYNKFVGKIGAGLMNLRCDRDEWAILIGGYLGTLARVDQYRPRRLKIATILENTGLGEAIGHRQTQSREKFFRALDRLQEEGVITGWKTEGFDDADVDPDDLAALEEYSAKDPYPAGDWRGWIVEFTFNFAADMHRLETREVKAVAAKTKRARKKKEKNET